MKRLLGMVTSAALCLSLASCGSSDVVISPLPDSASSEPSVQSEPSPTPATPEDDRGIDGLSAFALRSVLEGEPFNVPYGNDNPAPEEAAEVFATSASSSSVSDGIAYDYSLTMDSDGDIISGNMGVTSVDVPAETLSMAAELYFFALLVCPHDGFTPDTDAADTVAKDAVSNATADGYEFTIGNAEFTAYNTGLGAYWIEVAKAE